MRAYLLVFDREPLKYDYKKIHNLIKEAPYIDNWWHYIKSCYILTSIWPATKLSKEITKILPDHRFLLTQIHLNNSNGWLPQEAWDWLREKGE